ncbi:MAG: hypothetical protein ACI9MR_000412 [Myxococcota bacterium]|jgi:hypothetical protein
MIKVTEGALAGGLVAALAGPIGGFIPKLLAKQLNAVGVSRAMELVKEDGVSIEAVLKKTLGDHIDATVSREDLLDAFAGDLVKALARTGQLPDTDSQIQLPKETSMSLRPLHLSIHALLFIALVAPSAAAQDVPVVLDAMSRDVPLDIKAHYNAKSAWAPSFRINVAFGEVEEDDVLLVQHDKGHGKSAKKWGALQKCGDPIKAKRSPTRYGDNIVSFNCDVDPSMFIKKAGKFSARIAYRQTGTGVDHKDLRTAEYIVKKYAVDASGRKKQLVSMSTRTTASARAGWRSVAKAPSKAKMCTCRHGSSGTCTVSPAR